MSYTKGPWKVACDDGYYTPIDSDEWEGLAYVVTHMIGDVRPSAEGFANAALIAKAPTMYEALMQISLEACFISDAMEAVELLVKLGDIASKALMGVAPDSSIINELKRDKARLDWLADPSNFIGNVTLPIKCVKNNIHSMRDAIDEAMGMADEV